jgi:hypothetical protein
LLRIIYFNFKVYTFVFASVVNFCTYSQNKACYCLRVRLRLKLLVAVTTDPILFKRIGTYFEKSTLYASIALRIANEKIRVCSTIIH